MSSAPRVVASRQRRRLRRRRRDRGRRPGWHEEVMIIRFVVAAVLSTASLAVLVAEQAPEASTLAASPFPDLAGATLGQPVEFENEVDRHPCLPLMMSGEIVAWLHRTYRTSTTTLVERCVEFDPSIAQTAGSRHGGLKQVWERVVVSAANGGVEFAPLRAPGWGIFATPAFCGTLVAYWGTRRTMLVPSIYAIEQGRVVASTSLGQAPFETDNREYLPQPEWDRACTTATFDGRIAGRGHVRVVPR